MRQPAAGTDYDICVPAEEGGEAVTRHKDGRRVYYGERNIVLCPTRQALRPAFYKKAEGKGVFASREARAGCACRCTEEKHGGPMAESEFKRPCNEEGLAVKQVRIKGDWETVKERKSIVEHPFGTVKRAMDAGCCLCRGKVNAGGEFALAFPACNMKRAINILGAGNLLKAFV